MTLKEVIKMDNEVVYLDVNEFAELIEIDGVLLKGQVQYRTERKSALQSESFDGLHGDWLKVFFRAADYVGKEGQLPTQGEYIKLNGKMYKVVACKDEMGIVRIVASSYRQEQPRQFQRLMTDDND